MVPDDGRGRTRQMPRGARLRGVVLRTRGLAPHCRTHVVNARRGANAEAPTGIRRGFTQNVRNIADSSYGKLRLKNREYGEL